MKILQYVEIDLDYCALVYGEAPCTATLGGENPTGIRKCFNSKASCQDRDNYDNAPVTLRFAVPTDYLPRNIDCIPSIEDISLTPATISLGENLGTRATLRVTFKDHRDADTGPGGDKYVSERPYDPFKQGTYWGKFRARHPFMRGKAIRLIRGELGQPLGQMETRHYVIDSFDGPTPGGTFTLVAKDVLKLADGDRAQAPRLSNGFLVAGIDDVETTATLSPSGIGNIEYPAEGHVAIGGKEICAFTRSGDVLTLTRGELGTEAVEHSADDRVQLCLRYVGEDPADIIADLLQTYADVPSEFIPLANWKDETASFLNRVYTATIAEPTPVAKLVSELIEQAALALWWHDGEQRIRLQVLRNISTDAYRFMPDNFMEGSLATREQPDKRVSQVWTYFGQINPLRPVTEPDNFRSTAATVDLQSESDYGTPAIRKIYARWIPPFGRTVALRLNDLQLARFRNPPRRFNFNVFRGPGSIIPNPGEGFRLEAWPIQDDTGAATDAPIQVTRLNPRPDRFEIEAEEMLAVALDPEDLNNRVIIIDSNTFNFNLRAVHDTLFPAPTEDDVTSGVNLTCIVSSGAIVGSASTANPAFIVGDWPADFPITLRVNGRVQGAGGAGGESGRSGSGGAAWNGKPGLPGGIALYTRFPIDIEIPNGEIWGGGGGGGGAGIGPSSMSPGGGGGGAGLQPGAGGLGVDSSSPNGQPGTPTAGGAAFNRGGAGGDPGEPGANGLSGTGGSPNPPGGPGGAAGDAIDGDSFVNVTEGPGDIRGATVN